MKQNVVSALLLREQAVKAHDNLELPSLIHQQDGAQHGIPQNQQ